MSSFSTRRFKLLQDQFYGDVPQGEALTYDTLRGLVGQLGDPHTAFLDPKQAVQFTPICRASSRASAPA